MATTNISPRPAAAQSLTAGPPPVRALRQCDGCGYLTKEGEVDGPRVLCPRCTAGPPAPQEPN